MDFVASREEEMRRGWRNRVGRYLEEHGVTVFDPWKKPGVRGLQGYGREDAHSTELREAYSFAPGEAGAQARARCAEAFWQVLHIDLRMVDVSDFVVAYCPTNVYSVGTPHEIVLARQQHKPVLFVSPPVRFPALERLRAALDGQGELLALVDQLEREVPIKPNPRGIPSLWYLPLLGSEHVFDGFGFGLPQFAERFGWQAEAEPDECERAGGHERPLLPFLEALVAGELPKRWDAARGRFVDDDDWLLLDLCVHGNDGNGAPASEDA